MSSIAFDCWANCSLSGFSFSVWAVIAAFSADVACCASRLFLPGGLG